jgi:hypothetical protein
MCRSRFKADTIRIQDRTFTASANVVSLDEVAAMHANRYKALHISGCHKSHSYCTIYTWQIRKGKRFMPFVINPVMILAESDGGLTDEILFKLR